MAPATTIGDNWIGVTESTPDTGIPTGTDTGTSIMEPARAGIQLRHRIRITTHRTIPRLPRPIRAVPTAAVETRAVDIPVVVRDDTGAQITTDTISLAANGHLAFTLVTDKYPATANIRGTIEFDAPAGAQIGALGIRIPVAHTFTTLPALAK